MAGGVLKGFGGLFLVLGIVLMVAGVGAGIYAYTEQEDNEDRGIFADSDQSETNQQVAIAGGVAAAVGLILLIIAIVLLSAGGARSRNAFERALREPRDGAGAAGAASTGAAADGAKTVDWSRKAPAPAQRRNTVVGAVIVVALLLVGAVLAIALLGDDEGGLLGSLTGGDDHLGNQTVDGSTASTLSLLGLAQSAPDGDDTQDLTVPAATDRIAVTAAWGSAVGSPSSIEVLLQQQQGVVWVTVSTLIVPNGGQGNLTAGDASLGAYRIVVQPASATGASAASSYTLTLDYWRT